MRHFPRPAAVAFDLDGTLCDWTAGIDAFLERHTDTTTAERFRDLVDEHACARRDGTIVGSRHWMTRRDPEWFWRRAAPDADDAEIDRLVTSYAAELELPLFADARPTLTALAGTTRLALLSNGPHALERARRVDILDFFEVAEVAPFHRMKPHRDAFGMLVDGLDLPADRVLFVGDDLEEDVEGALAVGFHAVWLDRAKTSWPTPPGAGRIHELAELPALLADGP